MKKASLESPRSNCPISCTLEIVGDKWTLLVIRDLFLGKGRFKEFVTSPESIPTNILTDRLSRLVKYGIVTQSPIAEGSKRMKYSLTPRGDEIAEIVLSIANWGLKHIAGTSKEAGIRAMRQGAGK